MSTPVPVLHLFDAFGIELEYMIVRADDLSVLPVTDRVIHQVTGSYANDVERGAVDWSNELALHVIEFKCAQPTRSLDGLAADFHRNVAEVNGLLAGMGGRLLPTGMHPLMDPLRETKLWPHDYSPVYEAFDRIFNTQGHGWSNLQSMHINLPFHGDEEFGRLHAAIRMVLPILPALAASTPIMDGRVTGVLDNRLDVYRNNCRRIPSVTGLVVPEPVFTRADYEKEIFARMYRDIAPCDPEGILQHEWLNARGAIARFDRDAIEIRVLDVQESPTADIAIARLVVEMVRAMVEERWCSWNAQKAWAVEPLHEILLACIRDGQRAVIRNSAFLRAFGFRADRATAGDLWRKIGGSLLETMPAPERRALDTILREGSLARRIAEATGPHPDAERVRAVYGRLADCLAADRSFTARPEPVSLVS